MLRQLCLLLLLFHSCHAWMIKANHTDVHQGVTDNVTIQCCYGNDDNAMPRLNEVTRMIIRRRATNTTTSPWLTYVKVYDGNSSPVLVTKGDPNLKVAGYASKPEDSFLSMTWPKASPDTLGEYICVVNGFAADDSTITVTTKPITVNVAALDSQSLLRLVLKMKKASDETLNKIQTNQKQIFQFMSNLENRLDQTRTNQKQILSDVSELKTFQPMANTVWPRGPFALLKTSAGCQDTDGVRWNEGYVEISMRSKTSINDDDVQSNKSLLGQPIIMNSNEKNYVYLRTCKQSTPIGGPHWPRGSYCIHKAGTKCPGGFPGGFPFSTIDLMYLHLWHDGFSYSNFNGPSVTVVNPKDSSPVPVVDGCCRWDGKHTAPIILPVEDPFILYRYPNDDSTACQEVVNTVSVPGWLSIKDDSSNTETNEILYFCHYRKK